jgi:hypothetical protein
VPDIGVPHRGYEIALGVVVLAISILSDQISARDEVLEEKNFFWRIERARDIIWFHMPLVEWFPEDRSQILRLEKGIDFAWRIQND